MPARKRPAPPPRETPPPKRTPPEARNPAAPEPTPAAREVAPPVSPAHRGPGAAAAQRICQLYQLTEGERRLLELLLEADDGLRLGEAQRRLELSDEEILQVALPDGALRVHALIEVDDAAALGTLRRSDRIYPARGLSGLWLGLPADDTVLLGQLPGAEVLAAPPPGAGWAEEALGPKPPAAIVEIVRIHLVGTAPRLLWLSGCSAEARGHLVRAARARLLRPVVTLDCAALGGWPQPALWAALRRLRRDTDLRGAALVAVEPLLLSGAWRALCAPRPAGHTAPVILCSGASVPSPLGPSRRAPRDEQALVPAAIELRGAAEPAATAPAAAPSLLQEEPVSASKEDARRQAAIDAARAMGRPLPPELAAPLPVRTQPQGPQAREGLARPAPPPQAPPTSAEPDPAQEPAAQEHPQWRVRRPRAERPSLAPAPPQVEPAPTPEARPAPAEAAPPVQAAPPTAEAVPATAPTDDDEPPLPPEQPPLPLSPDAPLEEVVRVARLTPNPRQCVELLEALAGKRHSAVIATLRHHRTSANPAVRAAAEAGMASLFGPNWNRPRSIPPPVQPPRSDDGGRGPHGAF